MNQGSSSARTAFLAGGRGFAEVVDQIRPDAWDRPALGGWCVRDLVGHASRALSTVGTYLDTAPSATRLTDPVDYFSATRAGLADTEAVAQRGRDAGTALGDDPAKAVRALLDRVALRLEATTDDATVTTPVGTMDLLAYLPTRTFELAVHTLDLVRATGSHPPDSLRLAITASCELAGRMAAELADAPDLLLLLTGRTGLRQGLSVV